MLQSFAAFFVFSMVPTRMQQNTVLCTKWIGAEQNLKMQKKF